MQSVDFYFDFRSPYSYLASTELGGLKANIRYQPMDVLAVMKLTGNSPTTFQSPAKGRYARADLARWSARYGVPLRPNPAMSEISGRRLLRAALAAADVAPAAQVAEALFLAMWADPRPLGSAAEIAGVLAEAGIDPSAVEPLIDEPALDEALDRAVREAADKGVFGAPTFIADEQMFFGNDRLDFLRQHLESAQ
ncbi:2-hydroxychromene-2-carboxylate isomerase [Phenylobacterium montanum]|uniref:2-hydroxychromene-2-carboxylate isomerase n=1 Tax=Phenylobacterium montanum TaxID=2823693 RepID=A0A975G3K2_9CAUL|nr:2-hydroxychromene-2-carboxylate isomerase [Caulobacter sp. S6]QUD90493.1 2-hydroxychromene-2-carboxylate isomerase [Caulobacter sp. S6]